MNNFISKIDVVFLDKSLFKITDNIPSKSKLISKTINNKKADLNKGSGGRDIYLACSYNTKKKPITDIKILSYENGKSYKNEIKSDYYIVKETPDYNTADLNKGSGGNDIYIAYKKGNGVPITDLGILSFNKNESLNINDYKDWTVLPQNLNEGSGGNIIFLCYKKELNFGSYTVDGLKELCDKYGKNNYNKLKRSELIKLLSN